ncbi:type ISP restriction/modification enzyme [Thermogemmatispora onikobensis]|uniref:type ISP restriction/modification enzyme n=1 Tax=Thermogemmatispora onikobensis TaxID=732234 RepID=UPI000852D347|nr:type ISP restriction/modification enzyme [Thermogemmatispora onikobensis]
MSSSQFLSSASALVAAPSRPSRRQPAIVRQCNRLAKQLAVLATNRVRPLCEQAVQAGEWDALAEPTGLALPPEESVDLYTQGLCCLALTAALARSISKRESEQDQNELISVLSWLPLSLQDPFKQMLLAVPLAQTIAELQELSAAALSLSAGEQLATRATAPTLQALQQDPLIYCYEQFLRHYRPSLRNAGSIYATPAPVVSYMVRSVDLVLKQAFALRQGLVELGSFEVIDPAVGSGAFLHGLIEFLYSQLGQRAELERWSHFVVEQLLPNLRGYELLPAPWLVAYLSLGLKLAACGYDLRQRPGQLSLALGDGLLWLAREPAHTGLPVLIGNPPYGNFGRPTRYPWLRLLLQDYKRDLGERKLNLDDDFIKFIRCGQWYIEQAGCGLLAFITSHTYLDGLTHRRMRESLLASFDEIYLLDLHGNSQRATPAGDGDAEPDENVFPIRQGVAIGLFVRHRDAARSRRTAPRRATVHYAALRGSRREKYARLERMDLASTPWQRLQPQPRLYFFVPRILTRLAEWERYPALPEIFPIYGTGIKTHLDAVLVGPSDEAIASQIATYLAEHGQEEQAQGTRAASDERRRGTPQHKARLLRQLSGLPPQQLYRDYAYRPFDTRRIAYWPPAIEAGDHRFALMRHALPPNILLVTTRQLSQGSFQHVFVSQTLTDMCLLSSATRECAYVFPLYLFEFEEAPEEAGTGARARARARARAARPNLSPAFIAALASRLNLRFVPWGSGDLLSSFGPEAVLAYLYAILHASIYRQRYSEQLSSDFPRCPLPAHRTSFRLLYCIGSRLLKLHLQTSLPHPSAYLLPPAQAQARRLRIEFVHYTADGRLWLNAQQALEGLPPECWRFRIGHYQISARWLQERLGQELTPAEYERYRLLLAILTETQELMAQSSSALEALLP